MTIHRSATWAFEARVWPTGPVCPHSGVTSEHVTKLEGSKLTFALGFT